MPNLSSAASSDRTPHSAGVARTVLGVLHGLRAAWRTPAVIASSLATQLAPAPASSAASHPRDARFAVLVAHLALGRLARVRPARWRATCLYRSVAESLTLRALGFPARVVIGVGSGAEPIEVIAHAWVECEGVQCHSTRGAAELEAFATRRA
jgi:hypothetical protein